LFLKQSHEQETFFMAILTETEQLIPFTQAREAFPGGKRLSLATIHRWRLNGVRGTRLETILIGGSRYTSAEAIRRFIAAQNPAESPEPAITGKQRRTMAETANRILEEAGI
jgi:regulator of PEP synthase PpsR (kinase-PPPase family)